MGNLKEEVFATYTEWVKECGWFAERFKALSDAGVYLTFDVSVTLMSFSAFMRVSCMDGDGEWDVEADTIDKPLDAAALAQFKDAVRRKVASMKDEAQQRADRANAEMRNAGAWLSRVRKLSEE